MNSRWEADHAGHHFTIIRTEGAKGLQVECNGHLVSEKNWFLFSLDEAKGYVKLGGRKTNVEVSVGEVCTLKVDGKQVAVRTIK